MCQDSDPNQFVNERGQFSVLGRTNHFTSFAVLLGEEPAEEESPQTASSPKGIEDDGVSAGVIVGVVVGVIAAAGLGGAGLFLYLRQQKRKENSDLGMSVIDTEMS
jgi:hypothetical protein